MKKLFENVGGNKFELTKEANDPSQFVMPEQTPRKTYKTEGPGGESVYTVVFDGFIVTVIGRTIFGAAVSKGEGKYDPVSGENIVPNSYMKKKFGI